MNRLIQLAKKAFSSEGPAPVQAEAGEKMITVFDGELDTAMMDEIAKKYGARQGEGVCCIANAIEGTPYDRQKGLNARTYFVKAVHAEAFAQEARVAQSGGQPALNF